MIVEKKVVLCEKCRYFPIKAEHVGTQLLKIKQGSVVWKCKCCSNENANAFGGNQFVMLPENNFIKVSASRVLNSHADSKKYTYLVVLRRNARQELAYWTSTPSDFVQKQLKLDASLLEGAATLEKRSSWLAEYRRKKQALLKFTKPMQTDQNLVLRDEFEIYLLQEYLRKEVCRLSHLGGNFRMEISLVLVFKSRTFWFRVEDLEVAESNAALQHFLLISALANLDFEPSWVSQFYSQPLEMHSEPFTFDESDFTNLLMFGVLKERVLLAHKPSQKMIHSVRQGLSNQERWATCEASQKCDRYDFCPLADRSFLSYLRGLQQKVNRSFERVEVFCKGRRSAILKRFSLTKELSILKDVLLSHQSSLEIPEAELKVIVLKMLEPYKHNTYVTLVKLSALLQENGNRVVVLYTFDWSKIDHQKGQSLEQPTNYSNVFREDVLRESEKKEQEKQQRPVERRPFAKKNRAAPILQLSCVQVEDEDCIKL